MTAGHTSHPTASMVEPTILVHEGLLFMEKLIEKILKTIFTAIEATVYTFHMPAR
jgi:hypothetical protein